MSILIVEDDADLLRLMERLLRLWGLATSTATDGEKALIEIETSHPALVVTDYHMPHINGLLLARALREGGNRTPILMLTADGDWRVDQLAREAGVNLVLKKPINPEVLRQAIFELCPMPPAGARADDSEWS